MKVLIVDDEAPARRRLGRMIEGLLSGAEVLEAEDVDAAERSLEDHDIDLVLMDISMPGESGMELYLRRTDLPPVIFVTAHAEHAVDAFEARAVDYLLKPVSHARLEKALERLKVGPPATPSPVASTVTARRSGMIQIFSVDTISRFWASSKYTCFEQEGLEYLLDESLTKLQERFPQFVRVHRSELVNVSFVKAVDRRGGTTSVCLRTGEVVGVSRRYLRPLLDRLGA